MTRRHLLLGSAGLLTAGCSGGAGLPALPDYAVSDFGPVDRLLGIANNGTVLAEHDQQAVVISDGLRRDWPGWRAVALNRLGLVALQAGARIQVQDFQRYGGGFEFPGPGTLLLLEDNYRVWSQAEAGRFLYFTPLRRDFQELPMFQQEHDFHWVSPETPVPASAKQIGANQRGDRLLQTATEPQLLLGGTRPLSLGRFLAEAVDISDTGELAGRSEAGELRVLTPPSSEDHFIQLRRDSKKRPVRQTYATLTNRELWWVASGTDSLRMPWQLRIRLFGGSFQAGAVAEHVLDSKRDIGYEVTFQTANQTYSASTARPWQEGRLRLVTYPAPSKLVIEGLRFFDATGEVLELSGQLGVPFVSGNPPLP